ncbi:hypothetical protein [Sphingomonas zeae]|jgi:hypothetical protein
MAARHAEWGAIFHAFRIVSAINMNSPDNRGMAHREVNHRAIPPCAAMPIRPHDREDCKVNQIAADMRVTG